MRDIKRVLFMFLMVLCLLPLINTTKVYAASGVTAEDIESNGALPNDHYYFTSSTTYVYKDTNGTCTNEMQVSGLANSVKKYYYKQFTEMGSDNNRFIKNTEIFKGIDYSFTKQSPLKNQSVTTFCSGKGSPSGTFVIPVEGKKYKFYIPCATYGNVVIVNKKEKIEYLPKTGHTDKVMQQEGTIAYSSDSGIATLMTYLKEGIIAGNIQKGFNIGSVYSTTQKPLSDVMTMTNGGTTSTAAAAVTPATTTTNTTSLTNTTGVFFKFKSGKSMKASMDYFMCPLFGKIALEDLPKDDAAWEAKIKELDTMITGDSITINVAYLEFIDGTSPDREGIQDSGDLDFTNGVKAYNQDGLKTTEPLQKVNYNMRIAVPYYFENTTNTKYKLKADGLYIIPDVRMSVYNDTLYKTTEDGTVTKICTNADLELDRKYLAFFNQSENGEPIGVVVILRYNEAVIDTNNDKMYLTGRKITFGANYSSALNINSLNKDAMYYSTSSSGKQGVSPKYFSFNSNIGGNAETKADIYTDKDNHTELKTTDFAVYIDFATIKAKGSEGTTTTTPAPTAAASKTTESTVSNTDEEMSCFVIVRNNSNISDDGQLLNWLTSDEAKAMNFVEAESLRKKIRGEFDGSLEGLKYSDWKDMQNIKAELEQKNEGILIHIIKVVSIIFGVCLILLAILFALSYWFDIFNTFTDFSILYFISGRNMYPVADKESISYVSDISNKTKFVTFKDVLITSFICALIGVLFLNANALLQLFFNIYIYIMSNLGGM